MRVEALVVSKEKILGKTKCEEFTTELAVLLRKHHVAIIAKSGRGVEFDMSVDIGFQFGACNKWVNRHHVTGYDLDGKQ